MREMATPSSAPRYSPRIPFTMGKKIELEVSDYGAILFLMSTAEQIIHEIAGLRLEKQSEVLEFVEFLKERERKSEDKAFKNGSLTSAMRGMDDEDSLYSESDVIEKFG